MRFFIFFLASFLLFSGPQALASEGQAVTLAHTQEYTIQSDKFDLPLKTYVITPHNYDAAKTYPVLYAFDADLSLPLMVSLAAQVTRVADRAQMRAPIVVSIGYGDEKLALKRRIKDLTPFDTDYVLPPRPNGKEWPTLGGGDLFLEILTQEIKPFVEKRYSVDKAAETLYGHSLGGLLTLHCLASKPDAFDRYAAASPSLWFNDKKVIRDLLAFHQSAPKGDKIRLRLSIGSDEEELKGWSLKYRENIEMRKNWMKQNQMLTNANDLAHRLQSVEGKIQLEYDIYGKLEHAIANAPAFYDALRFTIEPIGQ